MARLRTAGSRPFSAASQASIVLPWISAGRSAGFGCDPASFCTRSCVARRDGSKPEKNRIVLKTVFCNVTRTYKSSMGLVAALEDMTDHRRYRVSWFLYTMVKNSRSRGSGETWCRRTG